MEFFDFEGSSSGTGENVDVTGLLQSTSVPDCTHHDITIDPVQKTDSRVTPLRSFPLGEGDTVLVNIYWKDGKVDVSVWDQKIIGKENTKEYVMRIPLKGMMAFPNAKIKRSIIPIVFFTVTIITSTHSKIYQTNTFKLYTYLRDMPNHKKKNPLIREPESEPDDPSDEFQEELSQPKSKGVTRLYDVTVKNGDPFRKDTILSFRNMSTAALIIRKCNLTRMPEIGKHYYQAENVIRERAIFTSADQVPSLFDNLSDQEMSGGYETPREFARRLRSAPHWEKSHPKKARMEE